MSEAAKGNVLSLRSVAREEFVRLETEYRTIKGIRDRHHAVARSMAAGATNKAIADSLGMSYNQVWLLSKDPSIRELVAEYQAEALGEVQPTIDETVRLQTSIRLRTLRLIQERLEEAEEAGEPLPLKVLAGLAADTADRTGYAKQTNLVVHDGDFATKLELARQRSARVIDLRPTTPQAVERGGDRPPSSSLPSSPPLQPVLPAAVEGMGAGRMASAPPPRLRRLA